jgi:hypothetical protein
MKTPKKIESNAGQEPDFHQPPKTEGSILVYTLGPKGGVGKTTTARLAIDGHRAAGNAVTVIQVDKAPTLPQLYEDVVSITVPSADEMRADPHAAVRAFEPFEEAARVAKNKGAVVVGDVGAGLNQRAFVDVVGRGRWDRHLSKLGIQVKALVLITADDSAMVQSAALIDELRAVHPSAEIVPVLNLRGGAFRFVKGTPAFETYRDKIAPLVERGPSLILPATADGSWQAFEAAGMTFTQAAMAEEDELMTRLGLSRLLVNSLQGDVSEFLATVWPRLGEIVGFNVGGGDAH